MKVYAKDFESAREYANRNFSGYEIEETVGRCACGESQALFIWDGDKLAEEICICEACYNEASNQERI